MSTTHATPEDFQARSARGTQGDNSRVAGASSERGERVVVFPALTSLPGDAEWRSEHFLSDDEVWKDRGYDRWATDELGSIRVAFAACAPNQQSWALNRAAESHGLLMPAHALPGWPPIPPQLRQDVPSVKTRQPHYHPFEWPEGYVPVHPKTGKPLKKSRCGTAWDFRQHILSSKGYHPEALEAAARRGYDSPRLVRQLLAEANRDAAPRTVLEEIFEEASSAYETEHVTLQPRKYLLTIRATKPWVHDHDEAYASKPKRRRRHLWKHHSGREIIGRHDHGSFEIPDDDDEPGKRLDMLPLAWQLLSDAEIVFLVIEGKIKADAILNYIRRHGGLVHGRRATVISVPAVWMWEAEELDWFLRQHCQAKLLVVVPDGDWVDNSQVITASLLCEAYCEDRGVRACIAAPPSDALGEGKKVGVDDYLGSRCAGRLEDLQVVRFETSELALEKWARRLAAIKIDGRKIDIRTVERMTRALEGLSQLGATMGEAELPPSLSKTARFLAVDRHEVRRYIETWAGLGPAPIAIEEGTLETDTWLWRTNRYRDPEEDFEDRPVIVITDTDLVARRLDPVPLSDWLEATSLLDEAA